MKRLELAFNIASIFLDSLLLYLAGVLGYMLRYRAQGLFSQYPILFNLSFSDFSKYVLTTIPYLLIILSLYGLYNLKSTRRYWQTFLKITAALLTGLVIFVVIYFFNQTFFPSRLIVLLSFIFAIVFLAVGRYILLVVERTFLRRGIGLHKLVLIVEPQNDFNLAAEIRNRPELGYKIVKILPPSPSILTELEEIRRLVGLDEVLQASAGVPVGQNAEILRYTHDYGIKFNYVPDIIESQRTNITVGSIAGIPIIELNNTPLDGWGRVVKRLCDVLLSLLAIIIASPLFILISLGILLDSPGRILFVQERFGQGKPFRFLKFRSMYQNLSVGSDYGGKSAEQARQELWKVNARQGPFLKIKNDPRVTRFGRFIRRTKLDELPQLFNVLMGDMSLVGPRAHVLDEVLKYESEYKRQFTIKPGITGLTQITQARIPDLPFEEEIRLDTFYLENWSLGLDFSILFRTVIVLLHRPRQKENY